MNRDEQLALAGRVAEEFLAVVTPKLQYKTRRRIDLEDCKQEAYLAVLSCRDAKMSIPAYLRRVVWNNLVIWLRREIRITDAEVQFSLPQSEDDPADGCGGEVEDRHNHRTAPGIAIFNEDLSLSVEAVESLDLKQRDCIRGHTAGETQRDIAARLGIGVATVNRHLHSGLDSLRLSLGGLLNEHTRFFMYARAVRS